MKNRKGTSKTSKTSEAARTAERKTPAEAKMTEGNGNHHDAPPAGEVVLYQSKDGSVLFDVRLEDDTVWLTQQQIADLLGTTQPNVSMHLKNIYGEQELAEAATYKDFLYVQTEAGRTVRRPVAHYNLDAIIAVGYRVNSKRGTQFRIWATRTLREHLLRGFTLNEKRLRERGFAELEHAVAMLARTVSRDHTDKQSRALLDVIERYRLTWRLLLQYDHRELAERPGAPLAPTAQITLQGARDLIGRLQASLLERGAASPLFGREHTTQLEAILGALEQTFESKPLYPTVQARAAHLLYFVIKDHPFADGNKRIGTLLFLEYLRRHSLLDLPNGRPRLANNAMVALALLIAESDPRNKELMIRLILNLLEDEDAPRVADSVAEAAGKYVVREAAGRERGTPISARFEHTMRLA